MDLVVAIDKLHAIKVVLTHRVTMPWRENVKRIHAKYMSRDEGLTNG